MNSIHASAVIIGTYAIMIRGESGAGKTSLGHLLIQNKAQYGFAHGCWLADDRLILDSIQNVIIASCPPQLINKAEVYGLGIVPVPAINHAQLAFVIDIENDILTNRIAEPEDLFTNILGSKIPFLRINTLNGAQIHAIFVAYKAIIQNQWPMC